MPNTITHARALVEEEKRLPVPLSHADIGRSSKTQRASDCSGAFFSLKSRHRSVSTLSALSPFFSPLRTLEARATMLYRNSLLLLTAWVRNTVGDAQCYGISGQKSSGSPCNSGATGTTGSHSSCCDESKQEACLSTGLCFATQRSDNNTFWAEGCTDSTGLDPACPGYCGATSQFLSSKSALVT